MRRDALGIAQVGRSHRIVGPLPVHVEARHWIIAVAGLAVAVAGAATTAYSQYQQGQQQQDVAKYQAKLQTNQAQAVTNQAQTAEDTIREQDRRVMAQQRAIVGGEGLSTEGSPLMILMDSAEQAQLEQARVRYGGSLQAAGFQNQAKLTAYGGAQYAQAGYVGAGSTLLTGASNALANYNRLRTSSGGALSGYNPGGYGQGYYAP